MGVIQTTSGQFPPCDTAGDASLAWLWTKEDKQTGTVGERKTEVQVHDISDNF